MGMTADERAENVYVELSMYGTSRWAKIITAAIRAAEQEAEAREREACAQTAFGHGSDEIAAAIRTRGKQLETTD